jgi:hypothetical protein
VVGLAPGFVGAGFHGIPHISEPPPQIAAVKAALVGYPRSDLTPLTLRQLSVPARIFAEGLRLYLKPPPEGGSSAF